MYVEELCFAGAASRGIAYIGVLEYLGPYMKLKKFVGVSIGSLIGICNIIGYNSRELLELVVNEDTSSFQDYCFDRIVYNKSILEGQKYKNWVWNVLSGRMDPSMTFSEFYERYGVNIRMGSVCLDDSRMFYFSHTESPDVSVYDGIIASMSIPFIFPPMVIGGKMYVDAFILNNYPIEELSESVGSWGFHAKSGLKGEDNFKKYCFHIFKIATSCKKVLHRNSVIIDTPDFDIIDFDLGLDDKITLYKRGYNAVKKHVENNEYFKNRGRVVRRVSIP